ncbi:MAG TPA: GNAT family N-acetyltransferase [Elusimicrobiota bacterium]|nr:GNAT family N-acetyltransferase [Elusimicrobiota bacterium]
MIPILFVPVVDGKDIAAVEALARRIWREHYIPLIGEAQVEYMLTRFQSEDAIAAQIAAGYSYYLMEEEGGRAIGYLSFVLEGDRLFLSKFYVDREHRGRGFGRRALQFVETCARKKGVSKITLTVNKNNAGSIRVYAKLGFVVSGPVVRDIGSGFVMDDQGMEKVLV